MPKKATPLTDMQVKKLKPRDRDYKVSDGGGLYLLVTPSGGKLWRFNYRYNGKYKTLALGAYPERSLADARGDRDNARHCWQTALIPLRSSNPSRKQRWRVNRSPLKSWP